MNVKFRFTLTDSQTGDVIMDRAGEFKGSNKKQAVLSAYRYVKLTLTKSVKDLADYDVTIGEPSVQGGDK